jgi:hypothetical protein
MQVPNRPACGVREQAGEQGVDPASKTGANNLGAECECDPEMLCVCLTHRTRVIQEQASEHPCFPWRERERAYAQIFQKLLRFMAIDEIF